MLTHSLREQPITRSVASAIAQGHLVNWRSRTVVDHNVLNVDANKRPPEAHKIWISPDKEGAFVEKCTPVNDILAEEIAKLQELVHRRPVAQELLDTIEEGNLVMGGCRWCCRWVWLRHHGSQRRLDRRIVAAASCMAQFGTLIAVHIRLGSSVLGSRLCQQSACVLTLLVHARALLRILACACRWSKAAQRWHLLSIAGSGLRRLNQARCRGFLQPTSRSRFGMGGRLWKKLLEVF